MLDTLYLVFIWPIEAVMKFILELSYSSFGSLGIAIVIMSIVVNIILIPLASLAEKWLNTERQIQQKLSPYIKEIKDVFKGQERFMMLETLYRQNHYHPFLALRASFGLLIQIPFFFAAFHFLSNYEALSGQSFLLFSDLSQADGILSFGTVSINIMPFIMTAVNIAATQVYSAGHSQKDRYQQYAIAGLFFILLYSSPSALVYYWTMNNVFTLCKSLIKKTFTKAEEIEKEYSYEQTPDIDVKSAIGNFLKIELTAIECCKLYFLSLLIIGGLVFVFTPISTYLSDPESFDFAFEEIAGHLAEGFFIMFLLLFIPFLLLPRVLKRFFCMITVGVAASSCLFTFILVGDYGALDFFRFEKRANLLDPNKSLKDFFIFIAIYYGVFRLLKEDTKKKLMLGTLVTTVAIFVVSIINYVSLLNIDNDYHQDVLTSNKSDKSPPPYSDDLLSFSKNGENVLVIMLDMFTGGHVNQINMDYPELIESLEGFTWYPNTLSAGSATFMGEPGIHGGHFYTPYEMNKREITSIIDETAKGYSVITNAFGSKDYDVSLAGVIYASCENIKKHTKDFNPKVCVERKYEADYLGYWSTNNKMPNLSVFSGKDQAKILAMIGVFRISSYGRRPDIYLNGKWAGMLPNKKKMVINGVKAFKKVGAIESFYQLSNTNSTRNTFKYIQTALTHIGWAYSKDTCEILSTDPYEDTIGLRTSINGIIPEHYYAEVCTLRALIKWFDWMKDQGIYNNTKIILVSDHDQGDSAMLSKAFGVNVEGKHKVHKIKGYPGRAHALLMVKGIGSQGTMQIDNALMSNADVPSIFCRTIGGCEDVIENYGVEENSSRTLPYIVGNWHPSGHAKNRYLGHFYLVKDNIFEPDNWDKLNNE